MPSGRRRQRPEPPPPVFFFDRGIGRALAPAVFAEAGYEVRIMADVYPDGADQLVGDEWIARASAVGRGDQGRSHRPPPPGRACGLNAGGLLAP